MDSESRLRAAIGGAKPDRPPVAPLFYYFAGTHAGLSCAELVNEPAKYRAAMERCWEDFGPWDAYLPLNAVNRDMMALSMPMKTAYPGQDLPDDSQLQFYEEELMAPEDYDCLLEPTVLAVGITAPATARDEEPAPAAAQKVMAKGTFVRIAYNDEGWVTLGYRAANHSVGEEWMVLQVGLALQQGVSSQTVKRSDIALLTPGPKVVTLASQDDFQEAGHLRGLSRRAGVARDEVELGPNRACVGRLYFHLPDGIELGSYNLGVKFTHTLIRVPFRIMTSDEEKELEKKLKEASEAEEERQ